MVVLENAIGILGSVTVLFLFFSGAVLTVILTANAIKEKGKRALDFKDTAHGRSAKKSPFGSLCLALAGTLGVGNISGVAAAISVGGAGAVFWMWVSALFCSALKYAEVLLAVRFRKKSADGSFEGGAHFYIKNGIGSGALAALFCLLCVFSSYTVGNITQVNSAAQSLRFSLGVNEYICGAVCFLLILIFCRSGSAIYSFTLRLIPLLCLGYIAISLAVIFRNADMLGMAFSSIIDSAFTPQSGMGGLIGTVCGKAVRTGITRGVMSNEAGCGTAPIAHASAEVRSPSAQGILGVIEVLFDTLFLCTLTALVILVSEAPLESGLSTVKVITSFASVLGEWVAIPISVAMLLFAVASAVGWSYYGRASLSYLGAGQGALSAYRISYAVCAFLGASFPEGVIWSLSDVSIYLMSLINTASVLLLARFLKKSENGIDIR